MRLWLVNKPFGSYGNRNMKSKISLKLKKDQILGKSDLALSRWELLKDKLGHMTILKSLFEQRAIHESGSPRSQGVP